MCTGSKAEKASETRAGVDKERIEGQGIRGRTDGAEGIGSWDGSYCSFEQKSNTPYVRC